MKIHYTFFLLIVFLKIFKTKMFKVFNNLRSHVTIDIILIQYATPAACPHVVIQSAKIFRRPKLLLSQSRILYCLGPRIMSSGKGEGGKTRKVQSVALIYLFTA